jgi:hypothetical protein
LTAVPVLPSNFIDRRASHGRIAAPRKAVAAILPTSRKPNIPDVTTALIDRRGSATVCAKQASRATTRLTDEAMLSL